MACFREAEQFLAKLPSISLEGMEPLGFQGAKEQAVAMDSQGYKVGLAGCLPFPCGADCSSLRVHRMVFSQASDEIAQMRFLHYAEFCLTSPDAWCVC